MKKEIKGGRERERVGQLLLFLSFNSFFLRIIFFSFVEFLLLNGVDVLNPLFFSREQVGKKRRKGGHSSNGLHDNGSRNLQYSFPSAETKIRLKMSDASIATSPRIYIYIYIYILANKMHHFRLL